jgi:hypothetical protein
MTKDPSTTNTSSVLVGFLFLMCVCFDSPVLFAHGLVLPERRAPMLVRSHIVQAHVLLTNSYADLYILVRLMRCLFLEMFLPNEPIDSHFIYLTVGLTKQQHIYF